MYQQKLMQKQIAASGVRIGDSCSILPFSGRKKAFTLNRLRIDLVSPKFRPEGLSGSYFELPGHGPQPFHYRLELDGAAEGGRFVLKALRGAPFYLADRLYIEDNRINFDPFDLAEHVRRRFEHPVLLEQPLLASTLKILIQGETGTGKSHLAAMIHAASGRPGKFVAVNLSSFNEQLIESELFGHKKGAFTGAIAEKSGAFLEAENGTLFLDEVDSLPPDLQTKLLTFLDSNRFRKVGDVNETAIRARLVFAAGQPLEPLVKEGRFRRDFYFRLKSGHTIELAALRTEPARIREACRHFSLRESVTVSPRLQEFYETLPWPGNLRQLFGHLEKKKVLSKSPKLDFDVFDEELLRASSDLATISARDEIVPLRELKADYVKRALGLCAGNVSLAARKLRLTEKTVKSLAAEP
jgi:transcriptional regulator of acetoin/glycerol metabolism